MVKQEPKWEIIHPGVLNLVNTKVVVLYESGVYPYHVHRMNACHGMYDRLDKAKARALEVVQELMEIGVDP